MFKKLRGFTLVEVMIVIVIIGMLTAFAVPNYVKSLDRADEKEAISKLKMIWEALQLYRAKNGNYGTGNMADVTAINQRLRIYLVPSGVQYSCVQGATVDDLTCAAQSPKGWSLSVSTAAASRGMVVCSAGTCPVCQADGTGCNN